MDTHCESEGGACKGKLFLTKMNKLYVEF
jgi:hypothetical protein